MVTQKISTADLVDTQVCMYEMITSSQSYNPEVQVLSAAFLLIEASADAHELTQIIESARRILKDMSRVSNPEINAYKDFVREEITNKLN